MPGDSNQDSGLVVLDFATMPVDGYEHASYTEHGFVATTTGNFSSLVGVAADDPVGNTGSISIRTDLNPSTVKIAAVSGDAFGVTSLEVDTYKYADHHVSETFVLTGVRADGAIRRCVRDGVYPDRDGRRKTNRSDLEDRRRANRAGGLCVRPDFSATRRMVGRYPMR